MKTSDLVRKLCKHRKMPISELAAQMGQSPQNLGKKLKRDTLTVNEMMQIADIMDATYFQGFLTDSGDRIEIRNEKGAEKSCF